MEPPPSPGTMEDWKLQVARGQGDRELPAVYDYWVSVPSSRWWFRWCREPAFCLRGRGLVGVLLRRMRVLEASFFKRLHDLGVGSARYELLVVMMQSVCVMFVSKLRGKAIHMRQSSMTGWKVGFLWRGCCD